MVSTSRCGQEIMLPVEGGESVLCNVLKEYPGRKKGSRHRAESQKGLYCDEMGIDREAQESEA